MTAAWAPAREAGSRIGRPESAGLRVERTGGEGGATDRNRREPPRLQGRFFVRRPKVPKLVSIDPGFVRVAVAKKSRLGQAICKAGLRLTHSGHEGDVKQSVGNGHQYGKWGSPSFSK